jgi:hypothetical protein
MKTTPVSYRVKSGYVHFSGLMDGRNAFSFDLPEGEVLYGMPYDEFVAKAGAEGDIDVLDGKVVAFHPGPPDFAKRLEELRKYYGRDK